ncbi:hypothetical protein [Halobellus rarus]|uniref:HNH endonuclease n=1 Tax=Halobellus rarus TaxID=1126237 RepID=A0ABD6CQM7_9EURY|nr:hypothetical protein [Halobellus rarus]
MRCYDCGTKITRPEKARLCVLGDAEHVVVLCLGCRSNRPSKRQYHPKNGFPTQPKARIPGGEAR